MLVYRGLSIARCSGDSNHEAATRALVHMGAFLPECVQTNLFYVERCIVPFEGESGFVQLLKSSRALSSYGIQSSPRVGTVKSWIRMRKHPILEASILAPVEEFRRMKPVHIAAYTANGTYRLSQVSCGCYNSVPKVLERKFLSFWHAPDKR